VTQHFATAVPSSIETAAKPSSLGENFIEILDSAPNFAEIEADRAWQSYQYWHDTLIG